MTSTTDKKLEQESPVDIQALKPVIEVPGDVDYEAILDEYDSSLKEFSEGEVVPGTVLKVTENNVVVDVGFKSEGVIPIDEFRDDEGNVSVAPGDRVDVLLESIEPEGSIVLSREKAERMKVWDSIEKAYEEQSILTGRVIERIKGGLAVDIGVRAFLPGSQVDMHPVRNLDSFRGEQIQVRVIKVNKRRGNIVLSRKAVLEEEYYKQKEETLKTLQEDKVVTGVVKNITDYGAFVDLGGIDGLLHITDMSWGRVNHPSDLFRIGDQIDVKVLKFDRLEEKVSLGYKQLTEDPWLSADRRYPKGARVNAKVVSVTDYGAFVELEEGIEGLIHISEMSWNKRLKHPSKMVDVGDEVEAEVLDVDIENRRISLGMKQTEPNPWDQVEETYAINSIVKGVVRNLTDFGAFVEVEEGVEGLVHVSDLSWTKKIKHPSEVLQKGQEVEAVVLNVDAENQRLSLGIKQLEPDLWEEFFSQHQVGDVVTGKIVRLTSFGAFVEIQEGIEGLCHVSELSEKRIENPEDEFQVGQEAEFKIIKLNLLERKIGLSIRALTDSSEREEEWSYSPEKATTSIAEIAGDQLGALKRRAEQGAEQAEQEVEQAKGDNKNDES
ncbi:MAG TPA: 30S ribosomal protein S1 [Acidobacteriota bacterium]|nr:30S ribosomal protein S1 [Acidobacteriota bacterium]